MNLVEYDKKMIEVFGVKSYLTLHNLPNVKRINFKSNNIEGILNEAWALIENLFGENEILARISFWDKNDKQLSTLDCILIEEKEDCMIALCRFQISNFRLKELIRHHLNYEIGLDPYLNVTVYFFNFNLKIILNIYDDRGADYLIK